MSTAYSTWAASLQDNAQVTYQTHYPVDFTLVQQQVLAQLRTHFINIFVWEEP